MRLNSYSRLNKPNSLNEDLSSILTLNQSLTGNRVDGLLEKWEPNLRAVKEAFGGKIDDYKLMTTAILLENTKNFLNSRGRVPNVLNEDATQPLY